jgi:diaminohydroxyphosphoribosylaminopyrimidine deaminase/5-amino-6-(5-phosphoribosylamino)uracil reductase
LGHWLRNTHDAILVGINTVLADNPALTTRGIPEGRHPVRVVLDSYGRLPENSRLLAEDGVSVFVATGRDAQNDGFCERPHVTVLQATTVRPELSWVLDQLAERGHRKVLIEGGSQLHASALVANLPNRLVLFLAPKVIGGQAALGWCGEWGAEGLADTTRWSIRTHQSVGEDLMIVADYLT